MKSVKFYKWAFNDQSIVDMGAYVKTNNGSFDFQQNFESGYMDKFDDDELTISQQNNVCEVHHYN